MKRLLLATTTSLALIGAAHAATYTYICRDHHKAYPVTLNTGRSDDCDGTMTHCTITWRGTTFTDVKQRPGDCRAEYAASNKGVGIDLCTSTKGVAGLMIGSQNLNCLMPGH